MWKFFFVVVAIVISGHQHNILSPNSAQNQFSPNDTHRLSWAKSTRIFSMSKVYDHKEKNIWSFTKFSQLILQEMYGDQFGEFVCGYWGLRVMITTLWYRASDISRKKTQNFAGFSGANSRKNRPISRDFCGRKDKIRWKIGQFRGILAEKSQISKDFQGQIVRKIGRCHRKFRGETSPRNNR